MVEKIAKNPLFRTLRFADFRNIWISQVFSQIALNIVTFALVLHIYEITKSTTSISLVMIATAIPVAIFGPFSGAIADRLCYRKILIYTNIFRFGAAVLLFFSHSNVLGLLEIILIISALSQFFTPAESSSIPLVVPQEKLIPANSLVMMTTYITLLIGYTVAGPLLGLVGSQFLFLICALLFLIATEATRRLTDYDEKAIKRISIQTLANDISEVWSETKEGLKYIRGNRSILSPMIKLTVGWTVLGALITLLPAYGEQILHVSTKLIGPVIIGPAGVGMIISALILSHKKHVSHTAIMNSGFILTGVALLAFSLYHFYAILPLSFLIMLVAVLIVGFGSSMIQIAAQTMLHINSHEEVRGRVFGISSMQLRLATTLPALVVGGVADLTSPLITLLIIAVVFFIYSISLVFE
jgi:MFS family permease